MASIPDFYYESQTAWESCGYIVHWADNVVYITRGSNNQYLVPSINDAIYSTTCLPVEYGKTYRIELSITSFADDSTRIVFKIDDIIYLNYFDRPQDGYTPIYMPEPNKDILKNDVSNYVSVFSSPQVILNISPVDDEMLNNASPNEVTTISSDLGPVDTINSTISTDLNGVPTNFETGIIKYTGLNSNNVLTFNLNFSEIGETIEIGYENGYSFKFKQNKVELYKNNNLIYVVDSTYVFIETKKDYLIEFKVLNLSNNKMAQISLKVNNEEMVNYLDSVNIINTTNNFYFKSDGFSGKINQIGYEIPKIIILNGVNADGKGSVGKAIELGVDINSDNVIFYVDEVKSSDDLQYSLENNLLTVNQEGTICVYAKVDDLYSDYFYIKIENPRVSFIDFPNDTVEVGSSIELNVSISDGRGN